MTVYELIKELIDYDPEAEIVFRGENDESFLRSKFAIL